MSNINPAYRNRVRFFIENTVIGRKMIDEPLGWDEDQKEYLRHQRHGVFSKLSNNLDFVGKSKELIDVIWEAEGVKADILVIKQEKHPLTNKWINSYFGYLDMLTRKLEDGVLSFKFNSGGVEKLRKSRESKKVKIEQEKTIDGEDLEPLKTEQLLLEGRRIFLKTDFDVNDSDNYAYLYNQTNGNTRGRTVNVPLSLVGKSHENAHSTLANTSFQDNTHERSENGSTGIMFFVNSDKQRLLRIKFKISFKVSVYNYDDLNWSKFWLRLATYKNGSNYNYKEAHTLWFADNNINYYNHNVLTFSYDNTITVEQGESLSLQFCQLMDGKNGKSAHLEVQLENIDCQLLIEEDSFKEPTQTKVVLAKEMVHRILRIITKKDVELYSEVLGRTDIGYQSDGLASLKAYAHGMWIRGYDALPISDDNKYKAFTTSLKDVLDDLSVTYNLALGIENIGYQERYIIEPKEYFYQDVVAHRLPYKLDKITRTVDDKQLYSSINIGFNEGFENEEAQGLDDFHANSSWNTTLGVVKNIYTKLSKFIASAYAVELIRRKDKLNFNTLDHKNDKKVFLFELKRGTDNLFTEKKWQDELESEPIGIFSPETCSKFLYSPLNLLLKHAKFIATGLSKYPYKKITLGYSEGNANLKTHPFNGIERKENQDLENIELGRPILLPEKIKFKHIVDFEINQKLQGYTEINGRKVSNLYLLWEFQNENGKWEKGYINNVKLNGEGDWELIKANR